MWNVYRDASCYSRLIGGKWEHTPLLNGAKPPANESATAAKMSRLRDEIEFPDFIRGL